MSLRFTLSVNGGAEITASSFGASLRQRQRYTQKADVVTMDFERGTARPMPFQPNDRVRLFLNGQPFFSGRVRTTPVQWNSNKVAVQLLGPWHELSRWTSLHSYTGTLAATLDPVHLDEVGARYELFLDGARTSTIYTGIAAMAALYQFEFLTLSDPYFVSGALPLGIKAPKWLNQSSSRIDQVLQQCWAWHPDWAFWFDYSVYPPAFRSERMRANVDTYTMEFDRSGTPWEIDPADKILHVGAEVAVPVTLGQGGCSADMLHLRYDMVIPSVTVRWDSPTGFTENQSYPSLDGGADVLWVSPDLGGAPPNGGVAEYLYRSYEGLRLDAQLVFETGEPYADARPGRVWDIQGDDIATGRGTAYAWTQGVTEDLVTGRTVCDLGYPARLGVSQILDLSQQARFLSGNKYAG